MLESLVGAAQSVGIIDSPGGNRIPDNRDAGPFSWDIANSIDGSRWNKNYPYQLVVLRANDDGGLLIDNRWRFTLPIPPEEMSITTPFAITTHITQGGVVEQHNGAPIRMISFSGSFGVYPQRPTSEGLNGTNPVASFFAGTIQASQGVVRNAIATITGDLPQNKNIMSEGEVNLKGTGYYQFRLLQKFLEHYAETKRTDKGRALRLALLVHKDQAAYLVSPIQLDVRRSKDSPFEYRYNLQFKAWRRLDPAAIGFGGVVALQNTKTAKRKPGLPAQILNRLNYARETLASARKTITSIKPDFDATVGETLRQTVLLLKDVSSTAILVSDLPSSLVVGMYGSVVSSGRDLVAAAKTTSKSSKKAKDAILSFIDDVKSGIRDINDGTSPAKKIFSDHQQYPDIFNALQIQKLALPPTLRGQIQNERNRLKNLTRRDFEISQKSLEQFAADYADRVGAGSATYDTTYGRTPVAPTRQATDQDYEILMALNEAIIQMGALAATYEESNPNSNFLTAIETIANAASQSGVDFQTPQSKFAVPVPYGHTLEQISAMYLGDPLRWHEIAALNNLREPYIDEVGFDLTLLTNGSGNTITVQDVGNLYIGQTVTVWAPSVVSTIRHIVDIEEIAEDYYAIRLDGDPDLSRFTTLAESKLHAFLPGTLNSQQYLYIPSDSPSDQDLRTKLVPGTNDFDHLLQVGGVDFLLTTDGDLAYTTDGDCRLSFGLSNIVQQVKFAFSTPRGSLILHPEFGLDVQPGQSNADFTAKDVLASVQNMFADDPLYTGVRTASVQKTGPTTLITLEVGIMGSDTTVPITINVQR